MCLMARGVSLEARWVEEVMHWQRLERLRCKLKDTGECCCGNETLAGRCTYSPAILLTIIKMCVIKSVCMTIAKQTRGVHRS